MFLTLFTIRLKQCLLKRQGQTVQQPKAEWQCSYGRQLFLTNIGTALFMNKGRIVQVMGPVVDVLFEDGELPNIKDALEVDNGDKTCTIRPLFISVLTSFSVSVPSHLRIPL